MRRNATCRLGLVGDSGCQASLIRASAVFLALEPLLPAQPTEPVFLSRSPHFSDEEELGVRPFPARPARGTSMRTQSLFAMLALTGFCLAGFAASASAQAPYAKPVAETISEPAVDGTAVTTVTPTSRWISA